MAPQPRRIADRPDSKDWADEELLSFAEAAARTRCAPPIAAAEWAGL